MKQLITILFIIIVLFTQAQNDEEITTIIKPGQQVPEFSFKDSNEKTVSISDCKGKTVMIMFFATWCPPCRKELPHIQSEIYDKYKDNPKFKLLIFGREHSEEELAKFRKEQKFLMPILSDKDRSIYSKFAEKYIPRNFLIDATGKVIFKSVGFEEKDFSRLKSLIAGQVK